MLHASPIHIRQELTLLLAEAPAEMRAAIIALLPAAKRNLDAGYRPEAHRVPLKTWRGLMDLLASVASCRQDTEILLRVSHELLTIADQMAPPEEVLRQSARILVHALHAEMYVCRLRNPRGEWMTRAAESVDGGAIPLMAPWLEEGLNLHPLMHAVAAGQTRHVLSNNLQALERGGDSLDCAAYREGYRSRLAFVLRERASRPAFGLVQLYTRRENGFDKYDERFLAKCARIVSLTVGRRVALARDTLEKAAGAMAHYGNNTLNVIRNQAEYCSELLEEQDEVLGRVRRLANELASSPSGGERNAALVSELRSSLAHADLAPLAGHLGGVLEGIRRMVRLIHSLKLSAERPRLMHYALGQDVLRLEDSPGEEDPYQEK